MESLKGLNVKFSFYAMNPIHTKFYKIVQRLSPKHGACGVAQLPEPSYSHRKACLNNSRGVQLGTLA